MVKPTKTKLYIINRKDLSTLSNDASIKVEKWVNSLPQPKRELVQCIRDNFFSKGYNYGFEEGKKFKW